MKISVILCVILSSALALAEGTQTWEQTKFEDFEKGTARGVAIRSDGSLVLAPQFKQLYASPSSYLWAVASDAGGNVFAAAGAPARVYRIAPNGAVQTIFESSTPLLHPMVKFTNWSSRAKPARRKAGRSRRPRGNPRFFSIPKLNTSGR